MKTKRITFLWGAILAAWLTPVAGQTSGTARRTDVPSSQTASVQVSPQTQTDGPATDKKPLVVGPVHLSCINKPCSIANIFGNARGSGVNGPLTAQTGMTINIAKDNWWTGGKVGEVDGLNVLVRQNGPHSDSSGILVNVQNQGHGFLSRRNSRRRLWTR